MATFKIREHIPEDTKFLKYSCLRGKDIRIVNRLIYYLRKHEISLKNLLSGIIYKQSVVSKNSSKEKTIELWKANDLYNLFKKLKLCKGIELEENLQHLLCLSTDQFDLIMINKLVKVIQDFEQSR